MPSGSYLQVIVRCPYYQWDDGRRSLTCEGIVPGTRTVLQFRTRANRQAHMEEVCAKEYWKCPMCEAIDTVNEDE